MVDTKQLYYTKIPIEIYVIVREYKQQWSSVPSISAKRTILTVVYSLMLWARRFARYQRGNQNP